jgi:hypothetical protein
MHQKIQLLQEILLFHYKGQVVNFHEEDRRWFFWHLYKTREHAPWTEHGVLGVKAGDAWSYTTVLALVNIE